MIEAPDNSSHYLVMCLPRNCNLEFSWFMFREVFFLSNFQGFPGPAGDEGSPGIDGQPVSNQTSKQSNQ